MSTTETTREVCPKCGTAGCLEDKAADFATVTEAAAPLAALPPPATYEPESAPLVMPAGDLAALKRTARILANIVARNHQAMEAARIEMRQNGPHAGMQWILNSLGDVWDDPETEWDGEESAQAWFDRTEEFYRATESAVDESAPVDTSRAVPARHAQRQERTGASQSDASESLGEVLHRARQAGGAGRPRPWPPEDWADRHLDLRALDEAMAEAVAAAARERDGAKLAAIRETLTASLTETGDELGVLERPADDSAMLDRALRLINCLLAIIGSGDEESP